MKTRLPFLVFLLLGFSLNAQWSQVGSTQFTDFATDADFAFDSSGTPYVVYDDAVAGTPVVQKFDGTNWVTVGNSVTWGTVDASLLAIAINPADNQPWVAWKEANSFIDVYKFDGTNWIVDSPVNLYVPTSNTPLKMVFNSNNEPNIYHHKSGGTASQRDYFRLFKQNSWAGSNVWTGFSSSFVATTDKNGETILNELGPGATSSQIRALTATGGVKFTVAASNVGVKRFNKLSMINNYWVGNDILNSTSGITFGNASNLSLPQPLNTSGNTGDIIKLVRRTQGDLLYLMFSDNSNQLQIQRYNVGTSQWSVLPSLAINTSASGFIVNIEVNESDNNLYVLYQDSGRLSMQKFEEQPALSRYYVNANVSGGDGSGDSWINAMTSLNDALGAADNTTNEIWVVAGTYKPGTSRSDEFTIGVDGLAVYGGFSGTETSINDRDILSNATILSGDVNGDDAGHDTGTRGDNNYHVVEIAQADNVLIDGFQISYGHANSTGTNAYGGAINIGGQSENLVIRNCDFYQNFGLTGGAIRAYPNVNTSMSIENCTFEDNLSRYGSGLYFLVNNNRTVTLDITNSLFFDNTSENISGATGYTGSALWARANGSGSNLTTTISNCTFANNIDVGTEPSSQRGALALSRRTDGNSTHNATINNSIFYFNDGASNATTASVNNGHVSFPNQVFVNNSIGEDAFSNLSFLTNTSNSNPLFTDENMNDFTLQTGSPAINVGNNSLVPVGSTYDILFNQRIFDTTVDLGAFEFGAPPASLSAENFLVKENKLRLYPNPTSQLINIDSNNQVERVMIFNVLGQQVMNSTNDIVNVSSLKNGVYLLKAITTSGEIVKRFIKQ